MGKTGDTEPEPTDAAGENEMNIHTPSDVLELMKTSDDYRVRALLALRDTAYFRSNNPADNTHPDPLPPEWLEELAEDENTDVVAAVAGNIHTPGTAFEKMSNHHSFKVKEIIMLNPSTPLNVLHKIVSTDIENSSGPAELNARNLFHNFLKAEHIIGNKKYEKIVHLALRNYMKTSPQEVAKNPATPTEILEELYETAQKNIKLLIAANTNAPYSITAAELTLLLKQNPHQATFDNISQFFLNRKNWEEVLHLSEIVENNFTPQTPTPGTPYKEKTIFENFITPILLTSKAAPPEFIREKYHTTNFNIYPPTDFNSYLPKTMPYLPYFIHPLVLITINKNTPTDVLHTIAETSDGNPKQEKLTTMFLTIHPNITHETLISENMLQKMTNHNSASKVLNIIMNNKEFSYNTIKTIIHNRSNLALWKEIKTLNSTNELYLKEEERTHLTSILKYY